MNLPVEVIEAVNEGRCVLFVGSRFSAEAAEAAGRPYPDDRELAKELGWTKPRRLPGMIASSRKQKAPEIPSVTTGARLYEAAQGRAALEAHLKARLGLPDVPPTDATRAAIRRFPVIFTTNLDDLLERAAADLGAPAEARMRGEPVPQPDPGRRVVYHLRGAFSRPGSPVLTPADREARPFPVEVRRAMRSLVRANVIFFVGYKPDEEEFELLWEDLTACYGGELPRCHMAVAQGRIDDYLWQKWVWRGLLMFTADPAEAMAELEKRITT